MTNVVKKLSISSELAQKMVDEAVAKAREIGVTENVAILDDGGNLKAFSRMDGAPILCIEIAQNKAYTALFGVPTHFFNFIQGDPSLLAGIPTLARVAVAGHFCDSVAACPQTIVVVSPGRRPPRPHCATSPHSHRADSNHRGSHYNHHGRHAQHPPRPLPGDREPLRQWQAREETLIGPAEAAPVMESTMSPLKAAPAKLRITLFTFSLLRRRR
jgi:uncharacterized protein GlcG (DUF336 family)